MDSDRFFGNASMGFFAELKRRNVFRVGVAYAVVAWLIAQIVAVVNAPLNLPEWFDTVVILLLLIGFPVALLLAWAFELTPEGVRLSSTAASEDSIRHVTGNRINRIVIVSLVLVLALVVLDAYVLEEMPASPGNFREEAADVAAEPAAAVEDSVPDLSIAVLPLRDLSPEGDQSWLADGLSDEITNLLTRVDDLLVINTISSFQFREQEQNFRSIRELLRVNYMLSGSLRLSGSEMRITVQLSSTADGSQYWSSNYEGSIEDVFAVQERIASEVSTALQITLGAGAFANQKGVTRSTEAYAEFLKGRQAIKDGETVPNTRRALGHFERALALDPDFANASAEIYGLYSGLVPYIAAPDQFPERERRAAEAADHIRQFDAGLPALLLVDAEQAMSSSRLLDAERLVSAALERAREIGISEEFLVGIPVLLQLVLGSPREAVAMLERARAIDPLNVTNLGWLAEALAYTGDLERALTMNEEARALPGQSNNARLLGNRLLLALYMRDRQLLENYDYPLPESGNGVDVNAVLLPHVANPQSALAEIRQLAAQEGVPAQSYNTLAAWAAYMGDQELALQLIRKRMTLNRGLTDMFIYRPVFAEMRKLPGFKQLVADMGLLEYWRNSGKWGDFCRPLQGNDDFECF